MFILKKGFAEFDMVDGPCAGKKYRHGKKYAEVPEGYEDRFESAKGETVAAAPLSENEKDKSKKTEDKKDKNKARFLKRGE
jgi:hypothetical protein